MNCCNCDPVIRLTDEGKRLSTVLKAMFFGYLALFIGLIVVEDFSSALTNIFEMIFVIITAIQARYQMAGLCVFLSIFNGFFNCCFIGLLSQNRVLGIKDSFSDNQGMFIAAMIIESIAVVFQFALAYFLFQAFCEFKAISKETGYCTFLKLHSPTFK
jgi:hypothetical protein